jgi:hypothetical protein
MEAIRRRRSLVAWIITFALLGNVVAAGLCASFQPAERLANATDLLGAFVICSSHGEQTTPSDERTPPPAKPCQLCTAAISIAIAIMAAAVGLLIPIQTEMLIPLCCRSTRARVLLRGALGSRAPPLPA